MPKRRPMGSLEAEVLGHLWRHDGTALTPGQVRDGLDAGLAYTTVMTILTRLWKKGLVEREPHGRAYAYRARIDEADFTAQRMQDALGRTTDHAAAFDRFARRLSRRDADLLRHALDERAKS
jgi:BlaI family transcriptional regulator, penicillinase repressor